MSEDVLHTVVHAESREAAQRRHRLEVHVDRVDGVLVITPVGDIDIVTGGLLLEALIAAVSTGESRLVVDLGSVPFMDSTGLSIFLRARRALAAVSGQLRLVIDDAHREIFKLPWLGTLFAVRSSVDDAVRDLDLPADDAEPAR